MCTEIYPNLQSMFASQESVNPTATVANRTTSFEALQVDTTEDIAEQLNQNRHNSINNNCNLLENRMVANIKSLNTAYNRN
jgi:hypothetical protein